MDLSQTLLAFTRTGTPPLVPELTLHLADRIVPVWEALETDAGHYVPPPFWAFPWVGGQALARYVFDHPELVRGRVVLDFGSGSGIVAIAAARCGAARVIAAEIDPLAAHAITLNAALNEVVVEPRTDDLIGALPPGVEIVLAGDVCYEESLSARVMAWLRGIARDGIPVLIGDPGRTYAPRTGFVELARMVVPTSLELENRTSRETGVWRLT